MNINDLKHAIPTVSNEFPVYGGKIPADFEGVSILSDDWRQIEFLPHHSLSKIKTELDAVNNIIVNHSIDSGNYLLFDECHVRDTIGLPQLQLKWDEVLALLPVELVVEGCAIAEDGVLVADSFTIKTAATSYYGTVKDGVINQLCMVAITNDARDEIYTLTSAFNLIAVNWREAQIMAQDE